MHVLVIINPKAGARMLERRSRALERSLREAGAIELDNDLFPDDAFLYRAQLPDSDGESCEITMVQTRNAMDASGFSEVFARRYGKEAMIVSCGGDGTMNQVLHGLYGTEAALMVVPYGTGNDFAKTIYPNMRQSFHGMMKALHLEGVHFQNPSCGVRSGVTGLMLWNGSMTKKRRIFLRMRCQLESIR